MTDLNAQSAVPIESDATKVWTDPRCVEFDVDTVTAAGGPGVTDGGVLS